MADQEKPTAKPEGKPASTHRDTFVEIVSFFVLLFLLMSIFNGIISVVNNSRLLSGGWAGLTPQGLLLSSTRPIASLFNPIDAKVVSVKETDVYDSPGEKKIGAQRIGAKGTIIQGPVTVNGVSYYYVDYDSGVDGWVKEGDIGYLDPNHSTLSSFALWLLFFLRFFKAFLILLSIILIFCIVHLVRKLTAVRVNERELLYPATAVTAQVSNPQWDQILNHVESLNENDWRQAILEADIMLAGLLEKLGLPGDSIGDKLKAVEKSDFTTLSSAWEAHKIRNQIAHEGSKFVLTQREARIVIGHYKTVFEEFEII